MSEHAVPLQHPIRHCYSVLRINITIHKNDFEDIVGGLYMTKEDPNVLMVEMKNSEYTDYVILIREQD